jgi:DNA end-binding protein Ku
VRPYWKGYLKLALVSCPIALHAACSTAERIAFRRVNKATGNRLRQQLIDEETGAVVASQDRGRGYELARGEYLIVADEELQAIEIESTHTIEIDSFVPRSQLDQRFLDTPYYIRPSEPVGQEAFAVIREAMRGKGMVALGRLVLSKRERVIALEAYDKGLLGTTLHYPYEVRKAEDYFCDLPDLTIAPDLLTLARHIVDRGHRFRPLDLPRPLRGGAARASESQTGRRRATAQADGCHAATGDQSHGGAAPQCRRGQKTRRLAQGAATARKRA